MTVLENTREARDCVRRPATVQWVGLSSQSQGRVLGGRGRLLSLLGDRGAGDEVDSGISGLDPSVPFLLV